MTTEEQEQTQGKAKWIWNNLDWVCKALTSLFGGVFGVSVVVVFQDNPCWIYPFLGLTSENPDPSHKYDALKSLGLVMGGILFVLQVWVSHKRAQAMEETAKAQARATNATEQGQRQERLKNAIQHLGHESVSVRLGGAYELFHLAEDTEALRKTALDILCAHIRRTTGEDEYQAKCKAKPSEEVQSLLTLLFVQDHQVFKGLRANLQGSFLNGADLGQAHLQRADLRVARLQGADLLVARLQGADLSGARLQGADLSGARLQGADLSGAYLKETVLLAAYLQGADLREACLQGADLSSTRLQGADLRVAHLQEAVLLAAYLQGAALCETHLQAAVLSGADLRGAGKYGWSVTKSFADRMNESIGKGSDLSGVVFEGGLSREDVDSLVNDLSDEEANALRIKLDPHVGDPKDPSDFLKTLKTCGAKLDAYTKKDADQWIAEYNKAMSEVPEKQ